jgi:hypothetical protein
MERLREWRGGGMGKMGKLHGEEMEMWGEWECGRRERAIGILRFSLWHFPWRRIQSEEFLSPSHTLLHRHFIYSIDRPSMMTANEFLFGSLVLPCV